MGPERLDPKTQLGVRLPDGGLIEIRFTNSDGKTEVWMVPASASMMGERVGLDLSALRAFVQLAYLDHGVDSRLGLQRERMGLMLRHIEYHEAELLIDALSGGIKPACTFEETLPE